MKNILFPTDFSDESESALRSVIQLAKKTNAKIFVLNAFYVPALDVSATPSFTQAILTDEKKEAEKELKKICARIASEKSDSGDFLKTECISELNGPGYEIVKIVKNKNIDLVIMNTSEKKSFIDFMASTSWEVINHTECSVLLIKEGQELADIKNIYFAVEDIKQEIYNIQAVVNIAKPFNAKIIVTHIHKFAESIIDLVETREDDKDSSAYINAIKEYVNYDHIFYAPAFAEEVAERLETLIEQNSCDLLAIVKKERGWIENLFHKSITKELMKKTNTPMLIVHKS